jgi:hypothetical protein
LRATVPLGDLTHFNPVMPTKAPTNDVMAHAVPMSRVKLKRVKPQMDAEEPSSSSEIKEGMFGDEERWEKIEAARAYSHGDWGREKLREYLSSPRSRGMRPTMRAAARLWVKGESQTDISRRIGIDQSNVSRLIKAALRLADGIA